MKKLCCLLLSLCFIITLSACKKNNDDTPKATVDLEYYAKLGQIPEAKYSLGTDIDTVVEELTVLKSEAESGHVDDPTHSHTHEEEEFRFEIFEGDKNVLIDNGNVNYYYNKANKDSGISYIVVYDTAYEFSLGTVISEIKKAVPNVKFTEEDWTEENAFFVSYIIDGTVLKAEFDDATIMFVFQENELYATAIYNNNWSN